MALADLHKLRAVLVTGKGGVGKTTVAAALARKSARSGVRTLAVEVVEDEDRDAPLAAALGRATLSAEPVEIEKNLHVTVLAPSIGHKAFLRDMLPMRVLADAAMKSQGVRRFLNAAPTFPELGVLYRLLDLTRMTRSDGRSTYEHVVVDLPASGHALALVQVPSAVLRVVPGGAIGHAVRAGIDLLCDPTKAAALVVTLPEPLPVSESIELVAGLEASRVDVRGIVLNRVPEDPFEDDELAAAMTLIDGRALLGGRSVQRVARARKARTRLSGTKPIIFESREHEGDVIAALLREIERESGRRP